jgi:hypothetical protein
MDSEFASAVSEDIQALGLIDKFLVFIYECSNHNCKVGHASQRDRPLTLSKATLIRALREQKLDLFSIWVDAVEMLLSGLIKCR